MSSPHRVVVTGCGLVTAHGFGWSPNARALEEGRSSLKQVTAFDVSRQRVRTAGEVTGLEGPLPENLLTARDLTRLDRGARLIMHALAEALEQSGLIFSSPGEGAGVPIFMGTSAAAMAHGESYYRQFTTTPFRPGGLLTKAAVYQPPHQVAVSCAALGLTGPVRIVSNACASGANAIGDAFMTVRSGRSQAAVCGGYDALCQLVFAGFDSLKALSATIPRPFDAARDGLALGEGAGMLILEERGRALARGANILAEITGYGAATDLHHLTQPDPAGRAAVTSMNAACRQACLQPEEIGYINAHGTGTPHNDVAEANAIDAWAAGSGRSNFKGPPVSSTKGGMGHLLGGAGAVEAIVCLMALREGFLPPSINVRTPDPACTFDLVTAPRRGPEPEHVLTNSFGFGGSNATLILSQPR